MTASSKLVAPSRGMSHSCRRRTPTHTKWSHRLRTSRSLRGPPGLLAAHRADPHRAHSRMSVSRNRDPGVARWPRATLPAALVDLRPLHRGEHKLNRDLCATKGHGPLVRRVVEELAEAPRRAIELRRGECDSKSRADASTRRSMGGHIPRSGTHRRGRCVRPSTPAPRDPICFY